MSMDSFCLVAGLVLLTYGTLAGSKPGILIAGLAAVGLGLTLEWLDRRSR